MQHAANVSSPKFRIAILMHATFTQELNGTTTDELFERQQAEENEEGQRQQAQLDSFAGIRSRNSTECDTAQGQERYDHPPTVHNPHIIALFHAQPGLVESAEHLAAAGGDALKVELERLGLKCGGTPTMRAERLFQTRDKPRSEWPKEIFAKRKRGAGEDRTAKRPQRGPMLPGQSRTDSMQLQGLQELKHGKRRPVGKPRGQGAGATEQVGIYRPNT